MARWRFRGELSSLDVALAVRHDRALRAFVERLAEVPYGRGKLNPERARIVVGQLLIGALDAVGERHVGTMDAQIDRIFTLRSTIKERYDRVLALFRPGAPRVTQLPPDLTPQSLAALFDQLDREVAAIEQRTLGRTLDEAADEPEFVPLDEVDAPPRGARDPDDVSPEVEPTLDLDSPDEEFSFRAPGEHDRAALARYREWMATIGESSSLRARVRRAMMQWAMSVLPGQQVTLFRVPLYSEGNLAAFNRFRTLDPTFAGNGYEVQIRMPDGRTFRPDGIRFLNPDGTRFQFLESKEPYTWAENAYYASENGQAALRAMLQRDAEIAHALRQRGCVGFRYETGHPDLDDFMAGIIAEMRAGGWPGADLLSPPMGRGAD